MNHVLPAELERFVSTVISRLGFQVHDHNQAQVIQLLRNRVERTGCRSVEEYLSRFQAAAFAGGELREIALELTVAETFFFRHPEHFQALTETALPERMKAQRPGKQLFLLSAGCASGEEAYSLAAAAAEVSGIQGWNVQIWGIDVNSSLLEKAREGKYSKWSLRAVDPRDQDRYFTKEGSSYMVSDRLKSAVRFESHNLLDPAPDIWRPDFYDVIFCRNVMIYFSPVACRRLVERLTHSLAPGGFLFLGPSETLRGISQDFHLRHTHESFYYQRRLPHEQRGAAQPIVSAQDTPASAATHLRPVPPEAEDQTPWISAIAKSRNRIASLTDRGPAPPEGEAVPLEAVRAAKPGFPSEEDLDEVHDLLRQERFDEALAAMGAPVEGTADSDALLLRAVLLANKGELAQAEAVCKQLLARDELRPGAHYLTAVCHERRGEHLSAAEHDQAAIYLDKDFAMPHLHLGLLARRLGDLSTARRELTEALTRLDREDASRILLFGGGFSREALVRFCRAQLDRCGERR